MTYTHSSTTTTLFELYIHIFYDSVVFKEKAKWFKLSDLNAWLVKYGVSDERLISITGMRLHHSVKLDEMIYILEEK